MTERITNNPNTNDRSSNGSATKIAPVDRRTYMYYQGVAQKAQYSGRTINQVLKEERRAIEPFITADGGLLQSGPMYLELFNGEEDPADLIQIKRISVLLADSQTAFNDLLAETLNREHDITVMRTTSDGNEAILQTRRYYPRVVLIGSELPYFADDGTPKMGSDVVKIISQELEIPSLIISSTLDNETILRAAEAGASGVLSKGQTAAHFITGIRRVVKGDVLYDSSHLANLLKHQLREERNTNGLPILEQLTRQEMRVLELMAKGLDNRSIAERLVVNYTTVRSHVQNVLEKLGAHSKLEAVARANGLNGQSQ